MPLKVAPLVLAVASSIACASAWSWTMEAGKVKFSKRDLEVCKIFEVDAATAFLTGKMVIRLIMLGQIRRRLDCKGLRARA